MIRREHTLAEFPVPETASMEARLIISALYGNNYIGELLRIVKPEFFSVPENRKVWETIVDMYNKREQIDVSTVFPKVDMKNFSENILTAEAVYGQGILQLGVALMETHIKKQAYLTSVNILQGIEQGEAVERITGRFKGFSDDISGQLGDNTTKNASDLANELADDIQSGRTTRIETPFPTLNFMLYGGLGGGNLIILAARPSVGKTTLALQMAQKAAKDGKKPTIYSLEMTSKELVQRLIVGTGFVSTYEIVSRTVNWEKYEEAVAMAVHQNLRINDKAKSLDELCTKIMLDAQTGQCDVAFIDYLGLINHDDRRKTLAQIIGDITKRLKNVAGECNIPVVLLAQLNRESAKENRSPQLTDLRDSGSIEQDADVVLMLERPRDEMGVVEDNKIDMWVRKNRGGKCNFDEAIHLVGNESYSSFYELAEGERYQEGGSNFEQEEQF